MSTDRLAGGAVRAEALPGGGLDEPAGAGRCAFLALLRQELLPRIEGIVRCGSELCRSARDGPAPFVADLRKMDEAGQGLAAFVRGALDAPGGGNLDADRGAVRHELGNRLHQVTGYCQILLLQEETLYFGAFADDLRKIHALCKECEGKLVHYHGALRATAGVSDPPARVSPCDPGESGHLLLVDDNARSREVLGRLLRQQGHRVTEAEDGREALGLLAGRKFDLVLLDILMPQVDGFQVLRELKEDERTRDTPVLVISALEEIDSVSRCIEAGAEDYLTKPVDPVLLQARVNSCLQKRRMRLRELEQFFPPEVARGLIDNPGLLREGREVDVTVLFCDIRGFSSISERLKPRETVEWVSAVMEALSECVLGHGGVVVDFIGDELMAMWGAPAEEPDHRRLACRAALDMLARLPGLNERSQERVGEATALGIGVNSGPALVGNTGTRRRFKYGPLGNTVNLASRVQGATKYLKAPLVVTGATAGGLDDSFATRRLAQVKVVNIEESVDLYEVAPAGLSHWPDLKGGYEAALQLFEARKLKEAAEILRNLTTRYGAQGPTLSLLSRTLECLVDPGRWKKVWDLPGK